MADTDTIDIDTLDEMEKEIAYLRAELKGFHAAMKFASDDTTKHIVHIYELIVALKDRVRPLEEKFFPHVVEARDQLESIIDNLKRGIDGKTDEKKS